MKSTAFFILLYLWLHLCVAAQGQHLNRRPFLGVQIAPVTDSIASALKLKTTSGARIDRIVPNSTAAATKLQPNDVILRINNTPMQNVQDVLTLARKLQVGEKVTFAVARGGKTVATTGKVLPMPFETAPTGDVIYDEVPLGGNGYARSIIKKPSRGGKHPAVFFIQGFGCGSLDNLPENDPQRKLMDGLLEKGYVVYRMEKPGVGDSKGTAPCQQIGYEEELAAFAAGLKKLKTYDFVDAENVFLFGHSLGANTAPIIASDDKVKGIITYGAAGKPWLEYLIEVFREQQPIMGVDYVQIDEDMKTFIPLLYEFMMEKKSPQELAQNPAYKKIMEEHLGYNGNDQLFGRHYTFLQELGRAPVNKAWKEAEAYTLAIYGEADVQAIDPDGTKMIADVVNYYYPGKATYEFLPRTDHGFVEVGTKQDYNRLMRSNQYGSFAEDNFNYKLVELLDTWMKDKLKKV